MADKHFRVGVEQDHVSKLTSARPVPAVAELIWNSLDADATRVVVEVDDSDILRQNITVSDNGRGFTHEEAEVNFGKIGGSWKRQRRRTTNGRLVHGQEGRGRLKALALGRVARWTVTYRSAEGALLRYSITLTKDDPAGGSISDPEVIEGNPSTGTLVTITEAEPGIGALTGERPIQPLTEILALYLTDYPDAQVIVNATALDPKSEIVERSSMLMRPVEVDGKSYAATLDLIEWRLTSGRLLYLCGRDGFPLERVSPRAQATGRQFSAYVRSEAVEVVNADGALGMGELHPVIAEIIFDASERIQAFFRIADQQKARSQIEAWKQERVYPFKTEAVTPVEVATRQVFDIIALNVEKTLPGFESSGQKSRAFQFRMLRQAIESAPEELQRILNDVLDLPPSKQKEFARLLDDADLGNIISAARMISDRLKFIHGLDALLFGSRTKELVKERSQLHRMLADGNTWVFGEEFNLSVDDQSLTEVLRKHRKLLGSETAIDKPVKRIDGKTGIVDLMLSKSVPQNHPDEFEHLVVELKRPTVTIGSAEITQIQNYAFTVSEDERFAGLKTRWSFWIISNEMDRYAKQSARQLNKPHGLLHQSEDGRISVWAKTWSEIISECKSRLTFVQDHLQANVDHENALTFLRSTYEKYLSGVFEVGAPERADGERVS